MANINRIRISGVTYSIEDSGATKTQEVTQAQYDALVSGGTVDPNVYYIITDATALDLSNYYTSAQTEDAISSATSGKADTSAVTQEISAAVSGKQDTLVSGTNIKTINNQSILGEGNITIQGGGGGGTEYSAGTGIQISDYIISVDSESAVTSGSVKPVQGGAVYDKLGGATITRLTQAEYDALVSGNTLDPNTLYFITDAQSLDISNYYTSAQTNAAINAAVSGKADSSAVTQEIASAVSGKADSSDVYAKSETSGATEISTALSAKQDTLSAGTNITITDGVISAQLEGGTVSRGDVEDMIASATSAMVDTSAITSSVTSASTDSEIPTAKAVFDAMPQGGTEYSAGTNISINSATTISCTLPLKAIGGNVYGNVKSITFKDSNSNTANSAYNSVIFGDFNKAYNNYNAIFGTNNEIIGNSDYKFIFGSFNKSGGKYSSVFGQSNVLNSGNTRSVDGFTIIDGMQTSFISGYENQSFNEAITLFGISNEAYNFGEFGLGLWNNSSSASTTYGNSGNTLFSVGNGTSSARHNAFEIRQNGDIYISSGGTDILLQDNLGGQTTSAVTSGSTVAVQSGAVYDQLGGLKLQQITQAAYDALVSGGTTDASTLYVIVD